MGCQALLPFGVPLLVLVAPFGWVDGGSGGLRRRVEVVAQALPWCLPGPGFGEVKAYFPCAGGDPGRDVDEFTSDRAGPGLAEGPRGEEPGGAGEVVCHDRRDQPGRIRGENTRWHVGQGAVLQIGIDLLNDGVLAVGFVRGDRSQSL